MSAITYGIIHSYKQKEEKQLIHVTKTVKKLKKKAVIDLEKPLEPTKIVKTQVVWILISVLTEASGSNGVQSVHDTKPKCIKAMHSFKCIKGNGIIGTCAKQCVTARFTDEVLQLYR